MLLPQTPSALCAVSQCDEDGTESLPCYLDSGIPAKCVSRACLTTDCQAAWGGTPCVLASGRGSGTCNSGQPGAAQVRSCVAPTQG